ncbi:kinase domain protein [Aspergillus indologenus CBS 114.80]|uniref:non-specific serine/threonine protein kinase n=1 Tax=Aspergillus indologenus CBS 114.80 TaxID=1450541 RepID=A0A2V5HYI2_9EURO|nr:kinase domain protein [Aspergillus indologenus CBS 114.80]
MAKFMKWAMKPFRRAPCPPMHFPTSGFDILPPSEVLEEERFEHFRCGAYYPANIGDVLKAKYQVIGKLGFGTTSAVWLARDLEGHQYVSLKIYTRDEDNQQEFQIYKRLNRGSSWHPGHAHVRKALDIFTIPRSGGDHPCLVQKPMWESFRDLLYRNPTYRFSEDLLKAGLLQILQALDYLHTECKLVHTDIKSDHILQEIEDKSILESFAQAELTNPSPRKFVNGLPVYASRRFDLPRVFGRAVLSDFGSAVRGDEKRNHDAQPNVYRSPEVMLKTDWSYPVDIWNVGAMVWDLFEGRHLFCGDDPDGKGYSTRAHLAEVMGLLGPPPLDMLRRGKRSHEFFTDDGKYYLLSLQDIPIPTGISLKQSEEFLEGRNKEMFLAFMGGMLQWRPEDRKTANELLQDPWLNDQIG